MAKLAIEVGEGQIQNAIAVGIAEAFSPERRDALLHDIVRAHLSAKKNSYDSETILSAEIGKHIREVAIEQVGIMVEKMRPRIGQIVTEHLGPGFQDTVCEQLKRALKYKVIHGVSIGITLSDDVS